MTNALCRDHRLVTCTPRGYLVCYGDLEIYVRLCDKSRCRKGTVRGSLNGIGVIAADRNMQDPYTSEDADVDVSVLIALCDHAAHDKVVNCGRMISRVGLSELSRPVTIQRPGD